MANLILVVHNKFDAITVSCLYCPQKNIQYSGVSQKLNAFRISDMLSGYTRRYKSTMLMLHVMSESVKENGRTVKRYIRTVPCGDTFSLPISIGKWREFMYLLRNYFLTCKSMINQSPPKPNRKMAQFYAGTFIKNMQI